MLIAVVAAVLVGAVAQRVTGVGFAMVVSPFALLALSVYDGVIVTSVLAIVSCAVVYVQVWRDVDWLAYARLLPPALIGLIAGTLLAESVETAAVSVIAGSGLLLALVISLIVAARGRVAGGATPLIVSSFASGSLTAVAGVGGPPMTIYAVLSRWEAPRFAATMQPYFASLAFGAIVSRLIGSGGELPELGLLEWGILLATLFVGQALGSVVARFISAAWARRGLIAIALIGSVLAILDGLRGLAA